MAQAAEEVEVIGWKDDFNIEQRTLGIAFIGEKKVSFRSTTVDIVLHELGHIYFDIGDLAWNSVYGGGEILLLLGLQNRFYVTEDHIRRYHSLVESTLEKPENAHRVITTSIAPKIGVFPHLFPISLYGGVIPHNMEKEAYGMCGDLQSPKWGEIQVTKDHLFSFFFRT